ncbi:zinc ribbon domain-containing protein [Picosynechococcus sp. PCC 7117]|uniref:zinc ribbon domain-containing protein n=1 Tax=Picosynechococcus sp. PCC 7117 TaxID=195498 RepID=UPI00081067BE|nr:zinc ribbon domain-containing protein [Picosynechococcus sp. PCC 7117]ANV88966.1 hypothetical protein AWQ22_15285 [Picosynechococcus sp. PCC 7117]
MTTPHFCMQCGAALNPGDRFCEVCGSATTPAYPAAPPPRPQAPPPNRSNGNWILGLGIVVLTGLGIFFLKDPAQLLKFLGQPEASTPQTQPVGENPPPSPTTQAAVTLDDFVGAWIPAEGNPGEETDTLVLYREGDKIVADIEGDRLELSNLTSRTLSGYVWSVYEDVPTPVDAELNEDKQRITFTVSPPNSEPIVAVAQRVQPGSRNSTTAPITTPSTPEITEAIAIEQVANLAAVSEWQALVRTVAPQNSTYIEVVEQTPTNYLIHVYETVNNPGEPSHTATYGWYEVDRQTGMVFEMLP